MMVHLLLEKSSDNTAMALVNNCLHVKRWHWLTKTETPEVILALTVRHTHKHTCAC